ncbi:MAG: SH3 domain-containing protein [Planctomycetota bacterium]
MFRQLIGIPFGALLLAFVLIGLGAEERPRVVYVQVESAVLREKPGYLSKLVGEDGRPSVFGYGTQLPVSEVQGSWIKVVRGSVKGWIHESAVNTKRIELASGPSQRTGVSDEEVLIAGKGFSKEVEDEYRKGHASLRYDAVDAMEKRVFSLGALAKFLEDGSVTPGTGP